jgi:RNA polymerase sigma-70 factor (ECF subfamily)
MTDKKDQEILLQRINDNRRIIFKICNSYCSYKSDREDLAQEIMYQLLKSYHSFNEKYSFSTWMYRVALNVAISFYRKKKTGDVITSVENQEDRADDNHYSGELEKNLDILQRFIGELKELDKALMLLYLESKSYKEIAEIIGITETNVATKISRIKAALKQKFDNLNS